MKKLTILAMFIALVSSFSIQANEITINRMHIWKDGVATSYLVGADLDSITFTQEVIQDDETNLPRIANPGAGKTTVVLYVPEDTPMGCYAVGSFNWDCENTEKMFTAVETATNPRWLAYTFDWTEDLTFKVLAIPSDSTVALGWDYQWGKNVDPGWNDLTEDNVVILQGEGLLELENGGEPRLVGLADGGVCFIHVKAWLTTPIIEPKPCETAAFKHPWGGGDWEYREATQTAEATFELNALYGYDGFNVATNLQGEDGTWYPESEIEFVGEVSQGDSVNVKFVSEKGTVGKLTVTRIEETENPVNPETNLPEVANPEAGKTTLVLYVPEDTPAGCYAVGTVNSWNVYDSQFMFTPLEGVEDPRWVACTFDYTADLEMKVIAIPSDPTVSLGWSYQWGKNMDPEWNTLTEDNVVILQGNGEFVLENQGQPKLGGLVDGGVCYIHVKAWATTPVIKQEPCETAAFHHPWDGLYWEYREAVKTAEATFELNALYGYAGFNVATDMYGSAENWYPESEIEFVGDVAQGDSVNVKFVSEKGTVGKLTVTLIEKGTPGIDDPVQETKDITVKAKVPASWTDVITAWVWPTGGEGEEVYPTKEGDWYVYTHYCAELNIIFKNGYGWTGDANQTVDITGLTADLTCLELASDGASKATYTIVDCEGTTEERIDYVVQLNPTELTLDYGASQRLAAVVTPADCPYSVVWESSNPEIATVNSVGVVEAVGLGTATITATINIPEGNATVGSVTPATCVVTVTNDAVLNTFEIGGYALFNLGTPIAGTDTVLDLSVGECTCQLAPALYYVWDKGIELVCSSLTGAGFIMPVENFTYVITDSPNGTYTGLYVGDDIVVDTLASTEEALAYSSQYGVYAAPYGQLLDVNMYGDAWDGMFNATEETTDEEWAIISDNYYGSQTGTPFFHIDFTTGSQSYYYGNVSYLYLTKDYETGELYYNLKLEWYDHVNPNRWFGLLAEYEYDEEGYSYATGIVKPYDMRVIHKQYLVLPPAEEEEPTEAPARVQGKAKPAQYTISNQKLSLEGISKLPSLKAIK